jgi:signal transduction histidine kinase
MEELSLHVLDIAENSIAAGAKRVEIRIEEDPAADWLTIEITDDGAGMTEEQLQRATDPFFTTRTTRRVGLGLPLLQQAALAAGGDLQIHSAPGRGTQVTARFRYSHLDRQPMGDLRSTLMTLAAGHPEIDWVFDTEPRPSGSGPEGETHGLGHH